MHPPLLLRESKGHFALWPKVKRHSIFTNEIAKNQEFNLSIFHSEVKKSKRLLLSKMSTWQYFLTKATNSWTKFGSERNGNPNYGWHAINSFFIWENRNMTRYWPYVRLEGWFWARTRVVCSQQMVWVWTLGLTFGGFTLCPAKGSNSYSWLVIFSSTSRLSTKFDQSIPWPLDLDGHSVKWP